MASRILHEFTIDKIAAVDRPCQEHATVAIMKRDNSDEIRKREIAQRLLKLKLDTLGVQVEKAWSDEARRKSAETRRRNARGKRGMSPAQEADDSHAVANRHGFSNEYSGGAGSTEWEHPRWPGHLVSVSDNGEWSHIREHGDGFKGVANGKDSLSLDKHLQAWRKKFKKAWSDEARQASIEARRGHGKSGVVDVDRLTPLTQAQKDHNYFLMHGKKPQKK